MTQKRKTSVNTGVFLCGRWDLNPKRPFLTKSHIFGTFGSNPHKHWFCEVFILVFGSNKNTVFQSKNKMYDTKYDTNFTMIFMLDTSSNSMRRFEDMMYKNSPFIYSCYLLH